MKEIEQVDYESECKRLRDDLKSAKEERDAICAELVEQIKQRDEIVKNKDRKINRRTNGCGD